METAVPTEVISRTHSSQRERSKKIKEAGGVQTWSMKYDVCHKQWLRPHGSLLAPSPTQPMLFVFLCFFLTQGRMYTDTMSKKGETLNLLPTRESTGPSLIWSLEKGHFARL